ncbi:MAG: hypothetical protein EOO62_20575, partial [Hymenobacter sp.]
MRFSLLLWAGWLLPLAPAFAQTPVSPAPSLGMPPARPAPPPQVLLMRVAQDGSGDYRTIQ